MLVSYPLVSPGGDVRDQILLEIDPDTEVLFISGDGDNMCDTEHLNKVRVQMRSKSWLILVKGADHGMNMKPKSATKDIGELTGKLAAEWLSSSAKDIDKQYQIISWDADRRHAVASGWAGRRRRA